MYSSLINSLITNKRFMHMVLTTRTSWCTCITQNELCGLQRQEFALWSCCRPDAACRWHAVAPVGRVLSAWRAFSVVDRGAPAPMQCSCWRCRRAKRRSASRLTGGSVLRVLPNPGSMTRTGYWSWPDLSTSRRERTERDVRPDAGSQRMQHYDTVTESHRWRMLSRSRREASIQLSSSK